MGLGIYFLLVDAKVVRKCLGICFLLVESKVARKGLGICFLLVDSKVERMGLGRCFLLVDVKLVWVSMTWKKEELAPEDGWKLEWVKNSIRCESIPVGTKSGSVVVINTCIDEPTVCWKFCWSEEPPGVVPLGLNSSVEDVHSELTVGLVVDEASG